MTSKPENQQTSKDVRLDADQAHEVCNIMVDVLHNLKGRSGIDDAFDQIDDEVMAELEQDLCNVIEPHVKFIYGDGYNDAISENEDER